MKKSESEMILERLKYMRKWLQGRMTEIDRVWKMKDDLAYYNHLVAQMDKRLERLERKLGLDYVD